MTVVPYIVPEHGPSTTTTLAYFAPPADGTLTNPTSGPSELGADLFSRRPTTL